MTKPVTIQCADGQTLKIHQFDQVKAETAKGVVIIAGAIGVAHGFYQKFAQHLNEQDYIALTFDYRGTGDNAHCTEKGPLHLADWGAQDIEAVIQHARQYELPVSVVGHSMGGQLLALAPSASELNKVVMVASSAPHWSRWSWPHSFKMLLVSRVIFPLVARLTKDFPTKTFGLGNITIPSGLFRQWARWMTRTDYLLDPGFKLDTRQYQTLNVPTLALGFSDDDLAPEVNIRHLMKLMPNLDSQIQIVAPQQTSSKTIGHTGFFRDKFKEELWPISLDWLSSKS
ncbi:alpha/beta fold hydrolase [Bacterioplanoides sp.]|uniref:alpha/beta hydrolase family protein n=1 Tax=Bacterioplanoides sp. TaxID=2066072 RepID=UPI003B59DEE0